MNDGNKNKKNLLGEPAGTASAKLRKSILFQLIVETGRDICFQCGNKIELIEELSIEHKQPWMKAENPRESFFDLDNIAFSHLGCNCRAADKGGFRPNARGGESVHAKLTWNEAEKIRERISLGERVYLLAREYNVDERAIRLVREEKTYKTDLRK